MPLSKKDALMKNLAYEAVAVIHDGETVALVEVEKNAPVTNKLETAFMKTNSISDAWWNNKGVSKVFKFIYAIFSSYSDNPLSNIEVIRNNFCFGKEPTKV